MAACPHKVMVCCIISIFFTEMRIIDQAAQLLQCGERPSWTKDQPLWAWPSNQPALVNQLMKTGCHILNWEKIASGMEVIQFVLGWSVHVLLMLVWVHMLKDTSGRRWCSVIGEAICCSSTETYHILHWVWAFSWWSFELQPISTVAVYYAVEVA